MSQRLGFIVRPKWCLVLCLVIGLALIIGLSNSQVRAQNGITITVPAGAEDLVLTPTGSNNLVTTTGSVTSDVPYNVAVKDKMEGGPKASGDAGQMVEWTGSAWNSSNKIADVVSVNTTHTSKVLAGLPHDVTASDFTIISNADVATDDDLLITVTVTTDNESALDPPSVYKITLTFTASAAS